MALMQVSFYSDTLEMCTSMNVIVPESADSLIGMDSVAGSTNEKKYPVLYLLHGMSDDHSIWLRRTSIERYASDKELIVVMPAVALSFYSDMYRGQKYWKFISDELPKKVCQFFHASDVREDTFAAGLSMGGFGAMKLGLALPEKYSAVASLSGAIYYTEEKVKEMNQEDSNSPFNLVFGPSDEFKGSINDFEYLADKIVDEGKQVPKLYACCGTEDFLLNENHLFKEMCARHGFELTYEEGSGSHEWGFWDKYIQKILDWLPLR